MRKASHKYFPILWVLHIVGLLFASFIIICSVFSLSFAGFARNVVHLVLFVLVIWILWVQEQILVGLNRLIKLLFCDLLIDFLEILVWFFLILHIIIFQIFLSRKSLILFIWQILNRLVLLITSIILLI